MSDLTLSGPWQGQISVDGGPWITACTALTRPLCWQLLKAQPLPVGRINRRVYREPRPCVQLTLEVQPRDVPQANRERALLKAAKRLGFKCLSITALAPAQELK